MLGTILVFVLVLCFCALWMVRTFDGEAAVTSVRQIDHALHDMLEQVSALSLDYAKWEEAADGVAAEDVSWLHDNIGSSAVLGEAMQLALIWAGPFSQPLGWTDDGLEAARPDLLPMQALDRAERLLAAVPVNTYEGATFFVRRGPDIYAAGVARIETLDDQLSGRQAAELRPANLLIALRLDGEFVHHVEDAFSLTGVEVIREAAQGRPSVPLLGADGRPVGHMIWDEPRPGTALFRRMLPLVMTVTLLAVGLASLGMMLVRRNARHLVAAEQEASAAARTDALTGLPNRAAFSEALACPARAGERAILFLDVNGFKRINDSVGHAAGDQVIVCVAQRLATLTDPDCRLARIAGDEFVFVITGPDAQGRTQLLAKGVERVLADPIDVLGHRMQLRMAMGYAVQGAGHMTGDDLVRQADLAMYEAKRHSEPAPVAFSALIEQTSRNALDVEQGLRTAIDRSGELGIAYQPIVAADGRLMRAEALARWTSPELGSVPPDRFIAVAEQAGLIIELGRKLLRLICDDLAAHPDLRVSVNVSPLQLMAPDFVPSLTRELQQRGIAPRRIEIELTEAVVVDDSQLAARRLAELHAAGISTALDDFGTGYSSIGYLEQMGFDTLKIDRSFVSGACRSSKRLGLLNAMILMAHNLGLRVVCEGVETAEELNLLRELGCDLAQGYHFDRPLPIEVLAERWLKLPREQSAVA